MGRKKDGDESVGRKRRGEEGGSETEGTESESKRRGEREEEEKKKKRKTLRVKGEDGKRERERERCSNSILCLDREILWRGTREYVYVILFGHVERKESTAWSTSGH